MEADRLTAVGLVVCKPCGSWLRRSAVTRHFSVAIVLSFLMLPEVLGQSVDTATAAAPVASDSLTEGADNYSLSASVPHARDLQHTFGEISQELRAERYSVAAELLVEVLGNLSDGFVEYEGVLHRPRVLIPKLIAELPFDALQTVRRKLADAAEESLQAALRNNDFEQLRSLAFDFPGTLAAEQATELWGAYLRDQGESKVAHQVFVDFLRGREQTSSPAEMRIRQQLSRMGDAVPSHEVAATVDSIEPSAVPLWKVEYGLAEASLRTIEAGHGDLLENGVIPFSHWTAKTVDGKLISISPTNLEVRDGHTGELIWSRPVPHYGARILTELKATDNPLRSWLITRAALFRVFGESLFDQFLVVQNRLYLIEEARKTVAGSPDGNWQFPLNRIVCLDLKNGEEVWSKIQLDNSDTYICSPPTRFGDHLLVTAEDLNTSQISVYELNAETGEQLRNIPLARSARSLIKKEGQSAFDGRRHKLSCPIVVEGAKAYCSTSAGMLACVDLATWQLEWIYRYPRHDIPRTGKRVFEPAVGLTGFQWWRQWQGIEIHVFGDYLAFVSPESKRINVIERFTGRLLWSIPQEDGLYIAAADSKYGVVVVGHHSVQRLALLDGATIWKSAIQSPSGRGVRVGDDILIPEYEMGWSIVDLDSGSKRESLFNVPSKMGSEVAASIRLPRNYVLQGQQLFELSYRAVKHLQDIQAVRDDRLSGDLFSQFFKLLERNEIHQASEKLAEIVMHEEIEEELLSSMTQQLVSLDQASGRIKPLPARFSRHQGVVRTWLRNAFEQAFEVHDLEQIRGLLSSKVSREVADGFLFDQHRRFRFDRWLVGQFEHYYASLTEERQTQFDDLIESVIAERTLDHPADAEFLSEIFQSTRWEIPIPDPANSRREVLQRFVRDELSQLNRSASDELFLPPHPVPADEQWSVEKPVVTVSQRVATSVYFNRIPVSRIDGLPDTDLNLEIEYPGHRGVRFFGKQWERPWPAYLPRSDRTLRIDPDLVRAWHVGPIIVLQVGSEVYGVAPWTAEGNRGATLLWPDRGDSIDTLGDRSNQMLTFQTQSFAERVGFLAKQSERLNEFGYYSTSVGPVRASYFCIQQKGMLVALETGSGKELWRRFDLPKESVCLGDENHVLMISPSEQRIQVLSSRDGQEIASWELADPMDQVLFSSGCHVLIAEGDRYLDDDLDNDLLLTLAWKNLASNHTDWQRQWPNGTFPFELDQRWFGVMRPSGVVEIIDTATGTTLAEHQVSLSSPIEKVTVHVGESDCLIIFSCGVEDERLLNAPQAQGGRRQALVKGPVLCISRKDGQELWNSELNNVVFPLDQPVDLPVFVTAGARYPDSPMDDDAPMEHLQLISRQTGEVLYRTESFSPVVRYNLMGNQETGVITFSTSTSNVKLEFKPVDSRMSQ